MSGLTFWTPSRLQTAANLAGLGLTAAEIALVLSALAYRVTPEAVRCACRRHGIRLMRGRGDSRKRGSCPVCNQ